MSYLTETIVAAATPPGRGGIAVIRVSGPLVEQITTRLFKKIPRPRYATLVKCFDIAGEIVDEGIALFFKGPNSFTGEDVLEFHGHGGQAIVNCIIQQIIKHGARLARPGEFSERAFLNDKIDLVQAEAIADLIDAASEQAARSATRSLQGEFSKKINQLVDKLIYLRTYIEASIDFVEEEIDILADQQLTNNLKAIIQQLEETTACAVQGSLLREGITAVIAGEPNVGKSSLLNCLSGKESAIVTNIAGTTRDVLREYIYLDGLPIHIIDTAGLRDSADIVEQEGIRRAYHELSKADIILFVSDITQENQKNLSDYIQQIPSGVPIILIKNKIDLASITPQIEIQSEQTIVSISVKYQLGIEILKSKIKELVGVKTLSEGVFSARRRHLDALERAHNFLINALMQLEEHRALDLAAEDLRLAQQSLSEITGEFTADDLLGKIFSSFCIGK